MITNRYLTKSKVFLYFCLSFILGIVTASFFEANIFHIAVILIVSVIAISVFWKNKKIVVGSFCIIFLLIGIYRYDYFSGAGSAGDYNENSFTRIASKISFSGAVVSAPEQKTNNVYYEVKPYNLKLGGNETYNNKILIILPFGANYGYGDLLEFKGKIKIPQDNNADFSYKKYLANKGIYFLMSYPETRFVSADAFCQSGVFGENGSVLSEKLKCQSYKILSKIYILKSRMEEAIGKSMPDPESSLASAILFGNDDAVSKDLLEKFNSTGTRHIMAVSGQNISILVVLLVNFAIAIMGASRRVAFYFALISIIFYIILIGMPASAVRAGIMGLLVLIAEKMGRLSVSYRALVFAATGMLALNPSLLVFDVGFQLSFAATLGIIFIYPALSEYFKKIPNILEVRSSLAMTLAALATTLPISILSFNQFSLVSPLANILIVPLVPLAMISGFIIIITNAVLPFLTEIIGWFSWLILAYEIKTVEFLSSFSFSYFKGITINGWYAVIYYFILAAAIFKLKKKEKLI